MAPLCGIQVGGGGKLVVFGGAIPLTGEDGRVVGGVGVSGGSVEQDQDVPRPAPPPSDPGPAA